MHSEQQHENPAAGSPWLGQAHRALPRLLALFDADASSPTYGVGDRYRWAWKLIDFANGTFQGAAHGLALLAAHGKLPADFAPEAAVRRIEACFAGADRIRRANGSLEEAFPYESSFCVTALVAFDLLAALRELGPRVADDTRRRWLGIVEPMIGFLNTAEETHGFIANHLATAVAALDEWSHAHGDPRSPRATALLERIFEHQSDEGWFLEYEGADPGYQTLCMHYLAAAARRYRDERLELALARSSAFLAFFAHPDGSYGGLYGSRNTRVFYPGGMALRAEHDPTARDLLAFMGDSAFRHCTVTLDAIDEPNLIPLFNSYCMAAVYSGDWVARPAVPALAAEPVERTFADAGLIVRGTPSHYTIVSTSKGGVVYRFDRVSGQATIDAGVLLTDRRGHRFSTQAFQKDNGWSCIGGVVTITARLVRVKHELPSPFQFMVLRLLSVTVMRSRSLAELIKQLLVRRLITGVKRTHVTNCRRIDLATGHIDDSLAAAPPDGMVRLPATRFSVMHMASQGYWQRQDDAT